MFDKGHYRIGPGKKKAAEEEEAVIKTRMKLYRAYLSELQFLTVAPSPTNILNTYFGPSGG